MFVNNKDLTPFFLLFLLEFRFCFKWYKKGVLILSADRFLPAVVQILLKLITDRHNIIII